MVISIASGKGGTGKTTVAVNLLLTCAAIKAGGIECSSKTRELIEAGVTLLDCDVEEPNAHIFLNPKITGTVEVSVMAPRVNPDRCVHCGTCAEVCAYNAILSTRQTTLVMENLCHGCGACVFFCPKAAMVRGERGIGRLEIGEVEPGLKFAQGILNPGEILTPRVIAALKRTVREPGLVIVDAPPGASCAMVEAIRGSDFCVLVTEPTPFGLHDLMVASEVTRKLGIATGVLINRADIGDGRTRTYCEENGLPVLAEIPFDRDLMTCHASGVPAVRSGRYLLTFRNLLDAISEAASSTRGEPAEARKAGES